MRLCFTLCMMGNSVDDPAWAFGINTTSVISLSNIPESPHNNHYNALSYHSVRKSIATKLLNHVQADEQQNPSDAFRKPLKWTELWSLVQPIYFRKEETGIDKPFL